MIDLFHQITCSSEPYKTRMMEMYDAHFESEGVELGDRLYEAYKCCDEGTNGDGFSASRHNSLFRAFNRALQDGIVPGDLTDPITINFIQHLKLDYHLAGSNNYTAQKAEREVDELVRKFFVGDQYVPREVEYDDNTVTETFDLGFLTQQTPMTPSQVTDVSPVPESELVAMTPTEFLCQIFNDKVLTHKGKPAYCSSQPVVKFKAPLYRPFDPDKPAVGHYDHNPLNVDEHNFVSIATFKNYTTDLTKDEPSRCQDQHASTPYVVFECDNKDEEIQQRFIGFAMKVSEYAPLVAVIDSGGKSLHFWFAAHSTNRDVVKHFKRVAALCGADKAVLNDKVRLVRMPNVPANQPGRRDQTLLYFDPRVTDPDSVTEWDLEGFERWVTRQKEFETYTHKGEFFIKTSRGCWEGISRTDLRILLALAGYNPDRRESDAVCDVDKKLSEIVRNSGVDSVLTRVAGYRQGVVQQDNKDRLLIKRDFVFPELLDVDIDLKRDCPGVHRYLEEVFEPFEREIYLGWLASSVSAAYNNGERVSRIGQPAQALHIIGDANVGKTLMLEYLMKPLFGNETAEAEGAFSGKNDFNEDLFTAILLTIDDSPEIDGTDDKSRTMYGEVIKKLLVASASPLHAKFASKVKIRPFWRLIRILNHEKIDTLPMLDDKNVTDKLIIIQTKKIVSREDKWYEVYKSEWKSEMDYFFTYLIRNHVIPPRIRPKEDRMPVISYIDPEVKSVLYSEQDPIKQFLDIMASVCYDGAVEIDGKCYAVGGVNQLFKTIPECMTGKDLDRWNDMFPKQTELSRFLKECAGEENPVILSKKFKTLDVKREDFGQNPFAIPVNACETSEQEVI